MITWLLIIIPSALIGIICARFTVTWRGTLLAGAVPWTALLIWLLYNEYFVPYRGGGASMWPIAQLFGGTLAAIIGITFHRLSVYVFQQKR